MKFKSAIITQGSGSLGGMTLSRNKGGMYLRARAIPTNPGSSAQTLVRNAMTEASTAWADTLTQTQRDAWDNYAFNTPVTNVLGDPLTLSGQQMYNRCNVPRIAQSATRVDDGPVVFGLPTATLSAFTATPAPSGYTWGIDFDDQEAWANEDDAFIFVQTSRAQKQSINFFKGPFRNSGNIAGDSQTPPTSPGAGSSPFAAVVDDKVFGRFTVSRADGRLGGAVIFDTIAVV